MLEDLVNWILFPVNVPFHYMNNGGLTKDDTTNSTSIYHLIRNFVDNFSTFPPCVDMWITTSDWLPFRQNRVNSQIYILFIRR